MGLLYIPIRVGQGFFKYQAQKRASRYSSPQNAQGEVMVTVLGLSQVEIGGI